MSTDTATEELIARGAQVAAQASQLAKVAAEMVQEAAAVQEMARRSNSDEQIARLNSIAREAAKSLPSLDVMAQQLAAVEQSTRHLRVIPQQVVLKGIESGERFGNLQADPAEWFIVDTGPTVWRIVGQFAVELGLDSPIGYRKLLSEDIDPKLVETVASYYEVPIASIQAALEHARLHSDAVIARLIADRSALPDRTPA